jgi:hypothetical protein
VHRDLLVKKCPTWRSQVGLLVSQEWLFPLLICSNLAPFFHADSHGSGAVLLSEIGASRGTEGVRGGWGALLFPRLAVCLEVGDESWRWDRPAVRESGWRAVLILYTGTYGDTDRPRFGAAGSGASEPSLPSFVLIRTTTS